MNCDKMKDMLLEYLREPELPADLKEHLNQCAECEKYFQELSKISNDIYQEEIFYPTQKEQDSFIAQLDEKIDQLELKKVTDISPKWKSYVPVAAAIVMILGFALISRLGNLFNGTEQINIAENGDSIWIDIDNSEIELVNIENYENILIDYSSVDNSISEELYIENVSEEEYQYLLENFDIGEIL